MITITDNVFQLDTNNTSMVVNITRNNHAELLHYGAKINAGDTKALMQKRSYLLVNSLYPDGDQTYGIDDMAFVYSYANRGDSRIEALNLSINNAGNFDFLYHSYTIDEQPTYHDYARSNGYDSTLKLRFKDSKHDLILDLWFLVYNDCDIITRYTRLTNLGQDSVNINAIMSAQFDLPDYGYSLATFDGAWGRECQMNMHKINKGNFAISARCGMSSPEHNPLFMLMGENCSLSQGDCYAFNLVYSGNHEIRVASDYMGRIRVQNGILRDGFNYILESNQSFTSPESVATYTQNGSNGASINLCEFTEKHIINSKVQPPIMLNSWEAMYFDISESKIMAIAESAKGMGFEALVIDDGWFGERNDDTSSLGDWYPNADKFPNGMGDIGNKLHSLGLKFGLWVEPEMISLNSQLYRTHLTWAVYDKHVSHIVGRNQYIIDLTKAEVQEYLVDILTHLVKDNGVDYLKWDFNRRFAELGSSGYSGMFVHDYYMGLYNVLHALNGNCPNLIIEGCASGGGRYDLGMLCFCPIIWSSDNTDPYSRMSIQEGTGYGYPISSSICHVSMSPNHQTQRVSTIDTRIAVATFGVLGAQMDVTKLNDIEREKLTNAIAKHKDNRQLGNLTAYRLQDGFSRNEYAWLAIDKTKSKGNILIYRKRFEPLNNILPIKLAGLDKGSVYSIFDGDSNVVVTATGITLMNYGLLIPQAYQGNEKLTKGTMLLDNTALLYTFRVIQGKKV